MIKMYSDKIDLNQLEKRVEQIVDEYENLDKSSFPKKQMLSSEHLLKASINMQSTKKYKILKSIQNILLKSRLNFLEVYGTKLYKKIFPSTSSSAFIIEEFLVYEDEEFIKVAYKTILKKEVELQILNHYLSLLRSGTSSKTEILALMRFSKEGEDKGVNILGLKKRNFIFQSFKIPLLGKIFKIFFSILRLPSLVTRIQHLESKNYLSNQNLERKVTELFGLNNNSIQAIPDLGANFTKLNFQLGTINHNLTNHIEQLSQKNLFLENKIQNYMEDLILTRRFIVNTQKDLQNLILSAKEQINIQNQPLLQEIVSLENKQLELFYIAFENKFRGSRADIKQRQAYYLPYIKEVISNQNDEVLDVGCGRGEWLELLKENNILAKGVDLNSLMIDETLSLGLDAKVQDAIAYLKSLEDETLSVISGFHIVEHLPFEVLVTLFDESLRVLKSKGMIIFETPNPENIFVGSCSFYTDPTHINPLPPTTLQFLAQNRGFKDVQIHRLHPVKSPVYPNIEKADDINTLIFASTKEQDYSIIGYK